MYRAVVSLADWDRRLPCTSPDRGKEICPYPRRSPPLSAKSWSHRSWPAQRDSSGAAMPNLPERPGAQESERHAGHRGQLRHGLARPWGGQRRTGKGDRVTIDSVRNHCERAFSSPKRRQSDLPGDPGAPGSGEPSTSSKGRHRAHAHRVLRGVMVRSSGAWWTSAPRSVSRPACGPPRASVRPRRA